MDELIVPYRLRVKRNVITLIGRSLPLGKGEVLATVGQEVSPVDILGEGIITAGYHNINLAEELEVSSRQAPLCLERQIGQTIFQGELLASRKGLLGLNKKNFLSPVDGILDIYDSARGILRLKLIPKKIKLVSGVFGIVEEVDKSSGKVIIRSNVTVLYGIFGTGQSREGNLKVLAAAGTLVSSKQIIGEFRDNIVVGGSTIFYDALEKAIKLGVAGIITGSIDALDYKQIGGGEQQILQKKWSDIGLSVMVTEGFGAAPIGADIFSLLKSHNGRYAILDGNLSRLILPSYDQNCMMNIRKTKLPPRFQLDNKPQLMEIELTMGAKVRVISSEMGLLGIVESIDQNLTLLPSGIKTILVTVETGSRKIRVPYQNLEVIGE